MNVGEDEAAPQQADPANGEPRTPIDPASTASAEGAGGASEGSVALDPVQEELVTLRRLNEEHLVRLRQISKAYTDLQAEMRAFKERMENRARLDSEAQSYDQVKAFFEPVMNLKRSLAAGASSANADPASLVLGLNMVVSQFMDALHKLGLSEIPGEGAPFDPRVHEALAVQPVTDPGQDGRVLMVHTTGFVVNGRVLQPAQVVIGKRAEPAGEA